ncbi:hypothetical protein RIF29_09073 [Crotalaria pallida]|uniref:Protein BIG GRAIN 1-like B n=1 Tax=Crotalaria pallida TaxID=3830 RepID=A0AAN9IJI0_CROPI
MERKMHYHNKPYPQRRRTPSFSSTLLDTIYHSIDESKSNLHNDSQKGHFNQTTHNSKHTTNFSHNFNYNQVEKSVRKEKMNLHRAIMIEDWMEMKSSRSSNFMNSTTSSSSESMFSSSETDTTHKPRQHQKQRPQREGSFARTTKLRALKIYGELNQKVKQPISPGSKIATFISSIFHNSSGNVKKAQKMCYVGAIEDINFEHKYSISKSSSSPCFSSSASSFSRRSCMAKTPAGKSRNDGVKRCVRFSLGEEDSHASNLFPLPSNIRNMTRCSSIKEVKKKNSKENCVEEASCCKGSSSKFGLRGFYCNGENKCDEDDDDDDALSYSSSDLFELDHLIGAAGRYQEELPVYETTNLETNKAIANGFRL